MSIKFLFVGFMVLAIFPFFLMSLISDLNRRAVVGLAAVSVATGTAYWFSQIVVGEHARAWLSTGYRTHALIGLVICFIVTTAAILRIVSRQKISALTWPHTMSQAQMERAGAAYLERDGWTVGVDLMGFAGLSIYRCRKDTFRRFVIFVRALGPFEAFVRSLRKTRGVLLCDVVVVMFEVPNARFREAVKNEGFAVINYKELRNMDDMQGPSLHRV